MKIHNVTIGTLVNNNDIIETKCLLNKLLFLFTNIFAERTTARRFFFVQIENRHLPPIGGENLIINYGARNLENSARQCCYPDPMHFGLPDPFYVTDLCRKKISKIKEN